MHLHLVISIPKNLVLKNTGDIRIIISRKNSLVLCHIIYTAVIIIIPILLPCGSWKHYILEAFVLPFSLYFFSPHHFFKRLYYIYFVRACSHDMLTLNPHPCVCILSRPHQQYVSQQLFSHLDYLTLDLWSISQDRLMGIIYSKL